MAVTCFGELLIRLTPPGSQLFVQAESLQVFPAGAEANVAEALAFLGHHVRFAGIVSDNALGDRLVASLRGSGVDTRFLARGAGRVGLYFMEAGSGPRPSSITYDREGSAFAEAEPDLIDFTGAAAGAKLLHTGGITPALGPKGVALAKAAHAAAEAAGVPVCFDGNYRAQLWDAWDSNPREILRELVAGATILIGNHRDISLLLDRQFSGDGANRRREAAEAAFAAFPRLELIASTARHLLTTTHHRLSARVDSRADAHQTEEISIDGVVDRIGTGDAFVAGVLHQWLRDGGIEAMADSGLALAALKHTIPGDKCWVRSRDLDQFSAVAGDVRR